MTLNVSIREAFVLYLSLTAALLTVAHPAAAQSVTYEDLAKLPGSAGAQRFEYGSDASQFGELRLPDGKGPYPVVVVIHGGCWYSEYDLNHLANFNSKLTRLGVATWSLEYRRIGNPQGGWPGTFKDVARGTDHLRVLARSFPLDLSRVIALGHSAGGQLALWLAARHRLPKNSAIYDFNPLPLRGVISLAGITDLRRYRPNCGSAVDKLLGGTPEEVPERYRQTSPLELLPLRVDQRLIHGALDEIVSSDLSRDYRARAQERGDKVRLKIVRNAGHFDLVAHQSSSWPAVEKEIRSLLKLNR